MEKCSKDIGSKQGSFQNSLKRSILFFLVEKDLCVDTCIETAEFPPSVCNGEGRFGDFSSILSEPYRANICAFNNERWGGKDSKAIFI